MEDKKVQSGQVPDGCIRLNVNIKKDLHMRLKLYSVRSSRPMNEIVEEWIDKYTADL